MSINGELWCQHDLLVTVRSPGRLPQVIRVNQPFARVGGHPEAEVPLPEELEHQRALYLHATQEGIFCLNLDPTAGLHSTTRWLRPGRTAQVGRTVIEAVFADAPDMTERDLGDLRIACFGNANSAHMQVCVAGQSQPVAVKHCRSPLTLVGRDKPAAMRLVHPMMSKTHCVLYWHERQLWVVDLLSAHRTMLDGASVTAGRVQPGQVLRFGNVLLTFLDPRTADGRNTAHSRHDHTMLEFDEPVAAARPMQLAQTVWHPSPSAVGSAHSEPLSRSESTSLARESDCATLDDVPEAEPVGDSDRNGSQHRTAERPTLSVTRLGPVDVTPVPAERRGTSPTDAPPALVELQQQLLAAERDRDELLEERHIWLRQTQEATSLANALAATQAREKALESVYESLESENAQLEEAESHLRLDQERLRLTADLVARRQAETAARLQELEQQRDHLLERCGQLSARLVQAEKQDQAWALQIEQWRLKEVDFQRERGLLETRLDTVQQKLVSQQREWEASQRAQSALQAQYEEAIEALDKQAHADLQLQARLREFEAAQDSWQAEQASLQARLTEAETREQALATERQGQEAATTQQERVMLEAQFEALRGEIDQALKRETTLRASLAEANAREAAMASEAHCHEERAANEGKQRRQLEQRLEERQAVVTAAEERQRELELALAEQERQIIELKQAQANRDADLQSARAQECQRQVELESRLKQLVEQEQALTTRLKHYEEAAAKGDVRRQEIELNAEHAGLLEHRTVLDMPPLEMLPRLAPILSAKTAGPANGQMLIQAPTALPTVSRTRTESETSPPVTAGQDDDLVNRLMMYQSRGLAARRRRLVIISIGVVATAVLAAGAMAWQSLSQLWSPG